MVLITKSKPKTTAQTKRRQGAHHKKDDRYLRPYWPYIPLILIVLAGLVFSNTWGSSQRGVLGYATEMSVSNLLTGTNTQRTAASLGGLTLNSKLMQAAQAKADDMAARNYWSHNTPDGATPWTFFIAAGYSYQTAGENLAYGFDTSDAAITAWMNSPEHRANILGNYTEVGFGVASNPDYQGTGPETIIVAEYGSPHVVATAPATPKTTTPKPAATPTPASESEEPAPQESIPTPIAETPAPTSAAKPAETNTTAAAGATQTNSAKTVTSKNVSRIQLLTNGQAAWSSVFVTMLALSCITFFFIRHSIFWHRKLMRGERFLMRHKLLDITLVVLAVAGFVLTRSAGIIR